MKRNDKQIGAPGVLYKNTKANIEALTVVEGAEAYATDSNEFGTYNGTSWDWGGGGTPGGSDTEVQFNDGGAFGGDANLTWDKVARALGIGDATKFPISGLTDTLWMVGDGVSPSIFSAAFGASNTAYLTGIKADGTAASPTNIKTDQVIWRFRGRGYDGTGWTDTRAEIRIVADGDWGSGDTPTRIELWTCPDGSGTLTLAMTIGSDGNINIATGKEYRVGGAQHEHAAADITSGTMATARLGSGTADNTTFLRGDQTWTTPSGGGSTDGWTEVSESWSYASASTITIPTDGTTKYRKYMKIRFKQGGGYKYYHCAAITATLLTVIVNDDYTVANAAITNIAYSFQDCPYGFPSSFNYTPTPNNITVGSATNRKGSYSIHGGAMTWRWAIQFGSGSAMGTGPNIPLPTGVTVSSKYLVTNHIVGLIRMAVAGTAYQGQVVTNAGSGVMSFTVLNTSTAYATNSTITSTVPATWTTSDNIEAASVFLLAE